MKICVFSDTHGHISQIKDRLIHLDQEVDAFWFLGDYAKDCKVLKKVLKKKISIVRGNCDFNSHEPEEQILEVEGKRVLLTHGHHYNVKNTLTTLYLKAKSSEVDLVCFGHTHMALYEKEGGVVFFNPGSPTSPRGRIHPSLGVVTIDKESILCDHIWL
ncbi:metallophosphoesterase family protein [Fusibacter ferrireducens]|uniref:Phosphoesterase n=1 Tax=Fusibacter ferrireducens TaxID=2785058 RepID=A0ABR9ZZ50_9FIRM|nr:metallophosphoesterase [Fusibacter ferrireducens]MBF4695236.1 metallophosphoesterase [Fusibacter ferrireducens]